MLQPIKRYTVERTEDRVPYTLCSRVVSPDGTAHFEYTEAHHEGGWLVHFPQGHITFFATESALREAGIEVDGEEFADSDTGEVIHTTFPQQRRRRA